MNETKILSEYICGIGDAALTPERLEDIRYKLLDWYGCALGGAASESAKRLRMTMEGERGRGESTAVCDREPYPLLAAAFLNGAESHILECDDVHKQAIAHPGIVAVTAALCMAEDREKTFREFALGVIAGYEVLIRLGAALNPSHYDHWHTTGTCGTFAAAAAAGKVLGLTGRQMEHAFGVAATMASGLVCVFGTEAKLVTVGNAIRNGIQAALLAQQGVESCPGVIERPGGYAEAVSEHLNLYELTRPGPLMIDTACYKLYASCGHTHSSLDALFALREESPFSTDEVEEIWVRTYSKAVELTGAFRNESASQAKFSLPYCLAAGVVRGTVSVEAFEPEVLSREDICRLAKRVTVTADPALDLEYPVKREAAVCIRLRDGRQLEKIIELPLGHPGQAFLEKKFRDLAKRLIPEEKAAAIQDIILSLERNDPMKKILCDLKEVEYSAEQHD